MLRTPRVSFGLAALKILIDAEDSCVTVNPSCKKTLMLLPCHLQDFKASIKLILDSKVTTYDEDLGGIILGQKNVKVFDLAQIEESGHVKVDIRADVYIFKPTVGCTLKGIVNKKGDDHVGCLVHNVFNSVIPRPLSCRAPWKGAALKIGQEILFRVERLDFSKRLPYIRGALVEDSVDSREENRDDIDSGIGCGEGLEEEGGSSSPRKKKKKKKEVVEEGTSGEGVKKEVEGVDEGLKSPSGSLKGILKTPSREGFVSPSGNSESGIGSPLPKKKKKKKKEEESEGEKEMDERRDALIEGLMESTRLSLEGGNDVGSFRKEKKKKHREEEEERQRGRKRKVSEMEEEKGTELSFAEKKKKKKKRHKDEEGPSVDDIKKALLAKAISGLS